MSGNLGTTALRRPRRSGDPMRAYDQLPPDLRRWMAGAALPWSPASCRRIWAKAAARGLPPNAITALLDTAEARTLSRERASQNPTTSKNPFKGACR